MSTPDGKLFQVEDLLCRRPELRSTMRLLLAGETDLLRVDNGFMQRYTQFQEMTIIRKLTLNREKILDVFIKLEVILTELIKIKLAGFNLERMAMVEEVLRYSQMHRKRGILSAWKVIDKGLSNQLEKLSGVRNELAHSWILPGIKYKEDFLKNNFEDFKADLETSWTKVTEIYMKEQAIHVDNLIERLEKEPES